jgi:hypothetical protein
MKMNSANGLRGILVADALISGSTGVLLLAGAGVVAPLLGISESLLRYAGIILVPFAGCVYSLSTRPVSRGAVLTVIVLNGLWVAGSLALLAAGGIAPTALGTAFVLAQAVVVAIFAELQYAGLRRAIAGG